MADAVSELLARLRLGLALVASVAGTVALVSSLSATSAPPVLMLAAAAAAVAALVGADRLLVTPLSSPCTTPGRSAGGPPALQAGHVTDSPRHPLRPRAPGPV